MTPPPPILGLLGAKGIHAIPTNPKVLTRFSIDSSLKSEVSLKHRLNQREPDRARVSPCGGACDVLPRHDGGTGTGRAGPRPAHSPARALRETLGLQNDPLQLTLGRLDAPGCSSIPVALPGGGP